MQATTGFIDHMDGANLRTLPAELAGSKTLLSVPLPPGTRVIVTGAYPGRPGWSRVTTLFEGCLLRGYVQGFRTNTQLPEPTATLYFIKKGDTLEPIAARIYRQAIEPGRDLRFYENVVLYVNQKAGRSGVQRVNGDIWLFERRLIWLVSPAFAHTLQGIVPDGSITNGAIARAKRVGRALEDILASVDASPLHFGEVAGQYAQAIQKHLPEIIGIVAAFLLAEALSAFLAATPTGVGQLAAAVIQLGLAAFGVQGMIEVGVEALKHAEAWLTQAWKAHGDAKLIAEASKSFLRMLVSIALVALAKAGVRTNLGRGLKLAQGVKITPPRFEMMAVAGADGSAVAVPVFRPGSITAASADDLARPMASSSRPLPSSGGSVKPRLSPGAELEALLQKLPNWERLKVFVGRRIPKPGTSEFAALKRELAEAGYQLDVMSDGLPYRLRRLRGKEDAALTVTEEGVIAVKTEGATRISVFSRYRRNYLDWMEQTQGVAAREAAAARISGGHQLHHLIPDGVAQQHPLVREALKRLEGYTIDRGTNLIDMPSTPNVEQKLIHTGSHSNYSNYVNGKLDIVLKNLTQQARLPPGSIKPEVIHRALLKVEEGLRKAIQEGNLPPDVVKELLEDGIQVGKRLAVLDPRPHDGSFTA
jgi:hypothetical protein